LSGVSGVLTAARAPSRSGSAARAAWCLLAGLLSGALAGCPDAATCALSADCPRGQFCYGGSCAAPAAADGGAQAAPGALGAACGERSDCTTPAGLACLGEVSAGFPDGYCTRSCATVACPAGSACADLGSSAGVQACLFQCAGDADCRPGYTCCAALGGGCAPKAACPVLDVPSATAGAACASRADCTSGELCETSAAFPGGVCTRSCVLGQASSCATNAVCVTSAVGPRCLPVCADQAACRGGYTCGQVSGSGDAKVCSAPGEAFRACTPPSTAAGFKLVNGGVAGPATDPGAACARPIGASALPAAQVQALGTHRVGEVVHFMVPPSTGSFSIVSQASSAVIDSVTITTSGRSRTVPNSVVPTLVARPDGSVLYDDNAAPPADGATAGVWFETVTQSTGALSVPNTSRALGERVRGALQAGTWSFKVNDFGLECLSDSTCSGGSGDGVYDLTVLTKPAAPDTGTVDLSFYLVTASLTAAQALTDPHVARFLSTLAILYGRAGLCLGTITFYDVPAWARARYATGVKADDTSPCGELDQMFTLSQPGNALNFFFVDAIGQGGGGGGVIVGLDGTIPGPSSIGGTIHSGAVVNASDLATGAGCTGALNFATTTSGAPLCGADFTAYLTAHEGGHWMGLYHSTEADGSLYDPVSDTPKCLCNEACVGAVKAANCYVAGKPYPANPTYLYGDTCTQAGKADCGGGDLLMFWVIDNHSVGNISPQQGQVVRSNVVVQ
jgi:hypothetical protein